MHKIQYLPLAEEDILDAVQYIAEKLENPEVANNLLTELDKTIEQLAMYPYSGSLYYPPRPMHSEIRKLPVCGYILYYSVIGDTVEIRRFIHGRRDRNSMSI